ncbi:hypothetical protein ADL27_48195, partial [Streptomyces sp. NRRL F-6602]
ENLFPPIPSEVILPLAGFTAATGQMNLVAVLIWTTIGSVVGAVALYWVGALLGRDLEHIDLHDTHDAHPAAPLRQAGHRALTALRRGGISAAWPVLSGGGRRAGRTASRGSGDGD